MRISTLIIVGVCLITLLFPEHAGYNKGSHASANFNIQNQEVERAVTYLQKVNKKKQFVEQELCGIEAFSDFFGEPKDIIASALTDIPCDLVQGLQTVVIYDDPQKPRALASASSLHLRFDTLSLPEAKDVLIHELGHIVDLNGIHTQTFSDPSVFTDGNATIYADDPSVRFYEISWINNTTWKSGISRRDFVTGYAGTDPFEDFSESFLLYIEHGNAFRAMTKESPVLQKKYEYLQTEVFGGKEFFTGTIPADITKREWDGTKFGTDV
jgi:hypothetical protein